MPPPPVPPPSSYLADESVTGTDRSGAVREDSTKSDAASANKAKQPQAGRGRFDNRTFRLALLLGALVVVAIAGTVVVALRIRNDQSANAGVVVPQSTPTTMPPAPSTLSGPAESVKALKPQRKR